MNNQVIKLNKVPFRFHIMHEFSRIETLDPNLPENEIRKYISLGGFSSIGFVKFIAERAHINHLIVSTLRVGKKQLAVLDILKQQGKLDSVTFICGSIQIEGNNERKYNYYDNFSKVVEKNDWKVIVYNNHSKILLFDTNKGKFVIETSSNLNENPKMEQFSFEKNEKLFEFYKSAFEEIEKLK